MLDVILDAAGQKGTGRWTAIEAQHLAAPIPGDRGGGRWRATSRPACDARGRARRCFGAAPTQLADGALTLDDAGSRR